MSKCSHSIQIEGICFVCGCDDTPGFRESCGEKLHACEYIPSPFGLHSVCKCEIASGFKNTEFNGKNLLKDNNIYICNNCNGFQLRYDELPQLRPFKHPMFALANYHRAYREDNDYHVKS